MVRHSPSGPDAREQNSTSHQLQPVIQVPKQPCSVTLPPPWLTDGKMFFLWNSVHFTPTIMEHVSIKNVPLCLYVYYVQVWHGCCSLSRPREGSTRLICHWVTAAGWLINYIKSTFLPQVHNLTSTNVPVVCWWKLGINISSTAPEPKQ